MCVTTEALGIKQLTHLIGRVLSSQTIGVEFSSKIIKIGTGSRRKRIKLQLWDTAGTERFRSVARSYYRGAAGAILVYDLASHSSFSALPTFLSDVRALASPNLTVLLAGNKSDLLTDQHIYDEPSRETQSARTPNSPSSRHSSFPNDSWGHNGSARLSASQTVTIAPEGREIPVATVSQWASSNKIPVSVEVSAYSGAGVEELFSRLARMILTKIELGEIDPDDPASGIQYGDASWRGEDGLSVKSGGTTVNDEGGLGWRRRKGARGRAATGGWAGGMREWEAVFRLDGAGRRRRGGCC